MKGIPWTRPAIAGILALALGLAGCGTMGVGGENEIVGTGSSFKVNRHDYASIWDVAQKVVKDSDLNIGDSNREEGWLQAVDGEDEVWIRIQPPESGYASYKVTVTNNQGAGARIESQPWEPKYITRMKAQLDRMQRTAERERRDRGSAPPPEQARTPAEEEPATEAPDRAEPAPRPAPAGPGDIETAMGMRLAPASGTEGVLVQGVKPGPAQEAGFEPGDIILELGGQPVANAEAARRMLSGTRSGNRIDALVRRAEWTLLLTMVAP